MILTGSFNESVSGSLDPPIGALFFDSDGSMRLMMMEDIDALDSEAMLLTTDFIAYAMERNDWMLYFINNVDIPTLCKEEEEEFPALRLIKGGKFNQTSSQNLF